MHYGGEFRSNLLLTVIQISAVWAPYTKLGMHVPKIELLI